MTSIFLTADQHFNYAPIIEYEQRPFKSGNEMNEALVENWNETVSYDDIVYHVGDFGFIKGQESFAYKIIERLNGQIIWIKGNHDPTNLLMEDKLPKNVIWVGLNTVLVYDKYRVFLTHRPIDASMILPTFCGHVHKKWKCLNPGYSVKDSDYPNRYVVTKRPIINVGVDMWKFKPVQIEDLLSILIEMKWGT